LADEHVVAGDGAVVGMEVMRTPFPAAARAVPRLMAVVVLPTPPFWLAIAKARMSPFLL
jgi:hypothetical protein